MQTNSTGTKLTPLHNKKKRKDLCNKSITFVNKSTHNKYTKYTCVWGGGKQKKIFQNSIKKVFEIMACLYGMYEALHTRSKRKEQKAKRSKL